MRVNFHPEAHADMKQDPKASGLIFLPGVEETTRRIERSPKAGPIERANIRKRLVFGFPLTVLYEIQPDQIYIAAVMHQHRRPATGESE
jgi:hypothetical protein